MRAFIILCLVAVACAQQFGYNYPSADGSNQVFVLNSGEGDIQNNDLANFAQLGQSGSDLLSGPSQGGFQNVGPAYLAPAAQSGSAVLSEPIQPASAAAAPSYSVPDSGYNKEFYSYSAPEEEFTDPAASEKISNALKQTLRVVFIKGPENKALENAALSLAKQASDQKTAIYVLNKQADVSELAKKLNALRNNNNSNNKPEVHFVKYRTPEDAANAQQQIQSQYDSLTGPSRSHNGGLAPVLNFASQGPVQSAPEPRSPGSSYLPSSIFRRFRL